MFTQRLPAGCYTRLQFDGLEGCARWLDGLARLEATTRHEMLAGQLEVLARTEVAAGDRLRMLELFMPAVEEAQAALAHRFTGRPQPLSIVDYAIWNGALELWQTLYAAYHGLFNLALDGHHALAAHAPLVALRCLDCTAASIRDHHRAYRSVPGALWRQAYRVFARAEQAGFADRTLDDPLRDAPRPRACAAALVTALLADRADPWALSARQMGFLSRWLAHWSALVSIERTARPDASAPALVFDLASSTGARAVTGAESAASVRALDLEQLGRTLGRTIALLGQGRSPASLALGDDCRQPGTEALISLLRARWLADDRAVPDRGGMREPARAAIGLDAVHGLVAGHGTQAGRAVAPTGDTSRASPTEPWTLISVEGDHFLDLVRGPGSDARIQHHQLAAIRYRDAIRIGVVQRLELDENGDLSIRVRQLADAITPLRVRLPANEGDAAGPWRPALRVGQPGSLIVEHGLGRVGRRLELDGSGTVTLTRLLEQGIDFERVAWSQ